MDNKTYAVLCNIMAHNPDFIGVANDIVSLIAQILAVAAGIVSLYLSVKNEKFNAPAFLRPFMAIFETIKGTKGEGRTDNRQPPLND